MLFQDWVFETECVVRLRVIPYRIIWTSDQPKNEPKLNYQGYILNIFGLSMMDELSFIYVGSNPRIIILKSRDTLVLDLILEFLSWIRKIIWFTKTSHWPTDLKSDKIQLSPVKSVKTGIIDFLAVNLTFFVILKYQKSFRKYLQNKKWGTKTRVKVYFQVIGFSLTTGWDYLTQPEVTQASTGSDLRVHRKWLIQNKVTLLS